MRLTSNVDRDIRQIKRTLVAGGLSVTPILGSTGMAVADDRDGVKDGKEDRGDDGLEDDDP